MFNKLQGIICAGGKSTRFNTGNNKVLETICGQEVILYPTKLFTQLQIPTIVVIGHQKEQVAMLLEKNHGSSVISIAQEELRGPGHALWCSQEAWQQEYILVMNGAMPLITADIIELLYRKHQETNAVISFVTAHNPDPITHSYDRVVQHNEQIRIVQAQTSAHDTHHEHCCISAGIYLTNKQFLFDHRHILQEESEDEVSIAALVNYASSHGFTVATIAAPFDHVRMINNLQDLWAVEQIKRAELIKYWMEQGVRFSVAQNVHIDLDVTIGAGSYIGCGVHLQNGTHIGNNVQIHEFSSLEHTIVGDNTIIYSHCIIKDSHIGSHAHVGPFAHVRKQTRIHDYASIGNFVEVKNSIIGAYTKAQHLSYLGDAQIGERVNIGAGTVTCNYDGVNKHQTTIKDNVFIGSDTILVAPVTIERGAFTAAGSTITQDVPADALAIARQRQTNKEDYAKKLRREKNEEEKDTTALLGKMRAKEHSMTSEE